MANLSPQALPLAWFERHPVRVAFDLIGCCLVVERDGSRIVARITETEAYGGDEDGASHATMYRVGRETLTHDAGRLYMQLTYGIHTMTNLVAHPPGALGAVLLRSAEDPMEGEDLVRERVPNREHGFLIGPGNLSRGMGTRLSDTLDTLTPENGVYLISATSSATVKASPRIGISRAVDARWRFFDGESRQVSRHRRGDIVTGDMLDDIIHDLRVAEPGET